MYKEIKLNIEVKKKDLLQGVYSVYWYLLSKGIEVRKTHTNDTAWCLKLNYEDSDEKIWYISHMKKMGGRERNVLENFGGLTFDGSGVYEFRLRNRRNGYGGV